MHAVSTRTLLILAAITGVAILAAGAIQILLALRLERPVSDSRGSLGRRCEVLDASRAARMGHRSWKSFHEALRRWPFWPTNSTSWSSAEARPAMPPRCTAPPPG